MIINGREVKFLYTIGAYCDLNDYVVAHQEVSAMTANIHKAVFMNAAYNEAHGVDPKETITVEELKALPAYEVVELMKEVNAAEEAGSKRTVEAEEKKPKKAEARKSN